MRGHFLIAVCVVGLVAVGGAAQEAQAQGLGCGFGPGAYGLGFFDYGNSLGIDMPRLPYYALFPPVYYSYPVPRTYGWSPFAYPPGTMTPDVLPTVTPVTILNPFVPRHDAPAAEVDKSASMSRTYVNPFVAASHSEAAVASAK